MKPFVPAVCVLTIAMSGCVSTWKSRSGTQATIYAETFEIPLLMADSTFVGEIDGVATRRGKGYVLADPGKRRFTLFHVGCPFPVVVVFCLRSVTKWQIEADVAAGAAYRIGSGQLIEVAKDGLPVGDDPDKR